MPEDRYPCPVGEVFHFASPCTARKCSICGGTGSVTAEFYTVFHVLMRKNGYYGTFAKISRFYPRLSAKKE